MHLTHIRMLDNLRKVKPTAQQMTPTGSPTGNPRTSLLMAVRLLSLTFRVPSLPT